MQYAEHGRRDDHQECVVGRQPAAEDFDGAAQSRGPRPEQIRCSPQPQRRVVDDEHQRKGGEELKQLRGGVNAPEQEDLDQCADDGNNNRADDDAAPEADAAADRRRQRDGEVGPQHVERAMRHVDDARDPEDEGKSCRDEEQSGCDGETVHGLKGEACQIHIGRLSDEAICVIAPPLRRRGRAAAAQPQSDPNDGR